MQKLERYSSIKDHLSKMLGVLQLLLSPFEDNEVKQLSETMELLKSVTLALQRNDMDMTIVRRTSSDHSKSEAKGRFRQVWVSMAQCCSLLESRPRVAK